MRVIKKVETPWVSTTVLLLVPNISEEWNLAITSCSATRVDSIG